MTQLNQPASNNDGPDERPVANVVDLQSERDKRNTFRDDANEYWYLDEFGTMHLRDPSILDEGPPPGDPDAPTAEEILGPSNYGDRTASAEQRAAWAEDDELFEGLSPEERRKAAFSLYFDGDGKMRSHHLNKLAVVEDAE